MITAKEKYGHHGKDKETVAQMKLTKFTRNKLKLTKKRSDEGSANELIEEYYGLNYRIVVDLDFKLKCVEIQRDFPAYREWLIRNKTRV